MSSKRATDELSAAYVLPSVTVDIRKALPTCGASQNIQSCSRVRRPRSSLRSNWVDGGEHSCLCNTARQRTQTTLRTFPIHCLAGNGPGKDDASEEGQATTDGRVGKGDPWSFGLKVWFKAKDGEEEPNLLRDKGQSDSPSETEFKGGGNGSDNPTSSVPDEQQSGITDKGKASPGSFRWPWQKNSDGDVPKQAKAGDASDSNIGTSNVRRRKKVTHTDSKPGGSLTPKGRALSEKDAGKSTVSSLQATWDKVMRVIAPNMPSVGDSKKGEANASLSEKDVYSKASKNGTHGTHSEGESTSLPRSSSIRELYSPPGESAGTKEASPPPQKQGSKWPKLPWTREEGESKPQRKASDAVEGEMKRPSGPRISTVETVATKPEEDSSQTQKTTISRILDREDGDSAGRDMSSHTQKAAASAASEEEDESENSKNMQKETSKGKEPALLLPSARSQLRATHIDMASIPQRDVAAIRLIFGSETFFATETLSPPGGLIFRGNLRGEPKATITKLEQRLATRLGDKYTLCLAEGEEDLRPVVVIVPTARDKRPATPRQRFFAVIIGLLTISTCLARGLYAAAFKPMIEARYPLTGASAFEKFFSIQSAISLTTAASIGVIILMSQIVQRMVASRYGTRIALPYFIPSFQLGSFGAVVQLASPTPTRDALFDIALSGAATLVLASLALLLVGLRLSTAFPGVVPVPMSTVSSSVVIGFLTQKVPHGGILVDYGRSLIGLHPLAVIGANCLTIAALNLLPMRQLDGGRIISALYGRRTAVFASRVTVMFLLLASTKSPYFVVFLAAVTFGPWSVDRPSKNELTEPDGVRTIVGYLFMLLMIGILLPYPASKFFGTL